MKTKHIVSRKNNIVQEGTAETTEMEASIKVDDISYYTDTVRITIDGQYMEPGCLRETAKLFQKLADALDGFAGF